MEGEKKRKGGTIYKEDGPQKFSWSISATHAHIA